MRAALTLSLILLAGCPPATDDSSTVTDDTGGDDMAVTLDFTAMVGSEAAACGTDYTLGTESTTAQLADARLFLSGIQLQNSDGAWVDLTLDDTDWQNNGIALLDFEDGTGDCADSGTSDLNKAITGTIAEGTYSKLRFDLGIPFDDNHVDSATAPAPLNSPGMFWVWQGGYKFVRVDFMGDTRWNVHVGSTGCASASPITPPTEACSKPNLASVELDLDPATQAVTLDFAMLVAGADITTNTTDTPPGCQSAPTEPDDCGDTWTALGMDFATGACTGDCAAQAVFGVSAR